jgi:hypothetical protein
VKCNQILWTAILKWEGKMYKRKKQETASRLISTILHFNTFKDCTTYGTFPHCTAANMTEGWTLLVVCTSSFIMYIHKKHLCNSWPCFGHFWFCPTKKIPTLTDLKIVQNTTYFILFQIFYSVQGIYELTAVKLMFLFTFTVIIYNIYIYIYKPAITSAKVRKP